jgi:tetratricopeptide (TPR) repeat protein
VLTFSNRELELMEYLGGATFLIADASPTRRTIQKLLSACHIKPAQIKVAENYDVAVQEIELGRPNVVFADHELPDRGGIELMKHHDRAVSVKPLKAFFLISNSDSNILANTIADENIDGLLVRPLSLSGLKEDMFAVLSRKIHPSDYMAMLQEGMTLADMGEFEGARKKFRAARRLDPGPALACYHEGMVELGLGDLNKAEECFRDGLRTTPTHYRCLLGMFDVGLKRKDYALSYEFGRKVAEHHTVPMKRLPDFILVAIQNHRFEDILEFYRLASSLGSINYAIGQTLGAGLVVAGLSFLRAGENEQAVVAFRSAEVATNGDPEILKRAYFGLLEVGMNKEATVMSARFGRDILDSDAARLAELKYFQKSEEPIKVLHHAIILVRKGLKDVGLFDLAIRLSVEINRKPSAIQHLIDVATQAFPGKAKWFASLAPNLDVPPDEPDGPVDEFDVRPKSR